MRTTFRFLKISVLLAGLSLGASAQVPSGGPYALPQSVVANGGGSSIGMTSLNCMVDGTTGQSAAGVLSTGSPYGITGGFSQNSLAPTAASVVVGGRVLTASGSPIGRVLVTLADSSGNVRSALTNLFGLYRFERVEVGQAYIISAESKRFRFVPRVVSVGDEIVDLDLVALP